MAQEFADGVAAFGTSSDVTGCLLDVHALAIRGEGHGLAQGNPSTSTASFGVSTLALTRGAGAWGRYSKRNILRTCILFLAVTGAALGTQRHLIAKILRYPSSAADHQISSNSHALRDDIQHLDVSHATANNTYRLPQIFQVGGQNAVWQVPASSTFFINWAAAISFRQGDVLRISGGSKNEDLDEMTQANYAGPCTIVGFPNTWNWNYYTDIYIQFTDVGTYYFLSDNAASCIGGLQFAATAYLMTIPPAPPRPNVTVPSRPPKVFQVGGDTATWTVPSTATFYEDWASNISFIVGDVLTFTLSDLSFQVDQVTYTNYEMCEPSITQFWYSSQSTTYQLSKDGIFYFIADAPQYCIQGMRFTVNVYPATGNPVTPTSPPPPLPPSPPMSPPMSPPISPPRPPPPPDPISSTPSPTPVPASPPVQQLGPSASPSISPASSPLPTQDTGHGNQGAKIGGAVAGIVALLVLLLALRYYCPWKYFYSPLHIFISHTSGVDGSTKSFAIQLAEDLKADANGSIYRRYDVFIDTKMRTGVDFPTEIKRKLRSTDLAIVVVTKEFFTRNWPMIELVKFVDSPSVQLLPLFYRLKTGEIRKDMLASDPKLRGEWDDRWRALSTENHPVDVNKYREAVGVLCNAIGVEYSWTNHSHDKEYIKKVVKEVKKRYNKMLIQRLNVGVGR